MIKSPKNLKVIIMSATLNSDQFQKYFAVHKITSLIIEP
jgi:HrpA-like RNA helicase